MVETVQYAVLQIVKTVEQWIIMTQNKKNQTKIKNGQAFCFITYIMLLNDCSSSLKCISIPKKTKQQQQHSHPLIEWNFRLIRF